MMPLLSLINEWIIFSTGKEINDFHVPMFSTIKINKVEGEEVYKDGLPPTLRPLRCQLMQTFTNTMSLQSSQTRMHDDLWPTTLIYGAIGSGKCCLAYDAAVELGLNFHVVNAVNFVGDTSAYTEAKLKALGEKVKSILPCVLYIRNIHVCHLLSICILEFLFD